MLTLMIDVEADIKMPALPAAEQITPDRYKVYTAWVGEHVGDCLTKTVAIASNRMEHGIRTKDSNLMDAAYRDLDRLPDHPEYDIANYDSVQVGILQAYRSHFWLRLDREPVAAEENWEAYQLLGPLLGSMLELDDAALRNNGGFSELLTHGSLLRSPMTDPQYYHMPASVREARHGGPETNHNVVGLHTRGGKVLHKSSAVKTYTSNKHGKRIPTIDLLKPVSILVTLCNEGHYLDQEAVEDIANRSKADRYLGFSRLAGQLMIKEGNSQELEPFEREILNHLTGSAQAVLDRHSICTVMPHPES